MFRSRTDCNPDSRKEIEMRKLWITMLMVVSATTMAFADIPAEPPVGKNSVAIIGVIILAVVIAFALLFKMRKNRSAEDKTEAEE